MPRLQTIEDHRLEEARLRKKHWKRWGPYLAERQWGTVREDYSEDGTAWEYFPFEHAHARAYRWGEDGIGGICDRHQMICFRFGTLERPRSHSEGASVRADGQSGKSRRGREGVLFLSRFHAHAQLHAHAVQISPGGVSLRCNCSRKIADAGAARRSLSCWTPGCSRKAATSMCSSSTPRAMSEDILIKITAINRGPEAAVLHLLPTLWFRNTWSWGKDLRRPSGCEGPRILPGAVCAEIEHWQYGKRWLLAAGRPELLFTENETNYAKLFNYREPCPT